MLTVFVSYARADGAGAALRLRGELEAMGFTVWRDVEAMEGGLAWKEQLRAALRQVDAVLVLITPGSVRSDTVTWEWENALTLGKRVIGLLATPCEVPPELKRKHYHDLSDPAGYSLGLARLTRDLMRMVTAKPAPPSNLAPGPKYQILDARSSSIGDNAVTVNLVGPSPVDADALVRMVQVLRSQAPGDPAVLAEIRDMLREVQTTLARVDRGVADLKVGQAALLARYDEGTQRVIVAIIARLDEQQAARSAAVLEVIDADRLSEDELHHHLAVIEAAIAEVGRGAAFGADPSLAQSAGQIAEIAADPRLEVKHKLKVAVPIVPLFLAYEAELEFNTGLNLSETWRQLTRRSRR